MGKSAVIDGMFYPYVFTLTNWDIEDLDTDQTRALFKALDEATQNICYEFGID